MTWYRGCEAFVQELVPLAGMTTYRVGGPAEYFATPPDTSALGELLARAAQENLPIHLLGHGSNLLVSDTGVKGVVVSLSRCGFGFLNIESSIGTIGLHDSGLKIKVGARHSLPALVKWSVSQGFTGLECLQGVPGTVGAALRMNAGGKYGEICKAVRRVRGFLYDGNPFDWSADECDFVYRNSGLSGRIVTECELELAQGDPEQSKKLMAQILHEKCASQPVNARSAGCVFKNPKQSGIAPAGKLIDQLGLKNMRVGGAVVSKLHANFLICEGGAAASDLSRLVRTIRQRVLDAYGIMLEMEVEVWGMAADELLPPNFTQAA